jgi:hypothetical protein
MVRSSWNPKPERDHVEDQGGVGVHEAVGDQRRILLCRRNQYGKQAALDELRRRIQPDQAGEDGHRENNQGDAQGRHSRLSWKMRRCDPPMQRARPGPGPMSGQVVFTTRLMRFELLLSA